MIYDLIKTLIKLQAKHFILVVDEVDSFSQTKEQQGAFTNFLKRLLSPEAVILKTTKNKILLCGVTFIGIANSVELFSGELTAKKSTL